MSEQVGVVKPTPIMLYGKEAMMQVTINTIFDIICLGGGTICACLYLYRKKVKGRSQEQQSDDE